MRKTFQYRAEITARTEANAVNWLYICRTLYNAVIEHRIVLWRQWRKTVTAYDQMMELIELKRDFPVFCQVSRQTLEDVIVRVDRAYKAFFRRLNSGRRAGYPRFRSQNRYDSFTLRQNGWKLEGKNLYIRNVGRFKLFLSRPIEGKIKTVTIRRTSTGQWFVSFSCDEVLAKHFPPSDKSIGLDVGISSFVTDSEGNSINNPRFFSDSERELRRKQRSFNRKGKGSNGRLRAKFVVAKLHERIANQRKDFACKLARSYLLEYGTIFIENLNIKNMIETGRLSKPIFDAAWSLFFNQLLCKAVEAGRVVVRVNSRDTSQLCSGCGVIVKKKLSVRIHNRSNCGLVLDRDHNAALNILYRGRADLEGLNAAMKVACSLDRTGKRMPKQADRHEI
jgi:putative transposase